VIFLIDSEQWKLPCE